MNFVITFQSSLRIYSDIAWRICSYFDNIITFIVNNRKNEGKTDFSLLISGQISSLFTSYTFVIEV